MKPYLDYLNNQIENLKQQFIILKQDMDNLLTHRNMTMLNEKIDTLLSKFNTTTLDDRVNILNAYLNSNYSISRSKSKMSKIIEDFNEKFVPIKNNTDFLLLFAQTNFFKENNDAIQYDELSISIKKL